MNASDPQSLTDILDHLDALRIRCDRVSIEAVTESFGSRSYGPLLLVPALIELSPIGVVPGMPTAIAAVIILFSLQILFGRRHLWLPAFIARRSISPARMGKALDRMRPVGRWADRWFHGRLSWLTRTPFSQVAAAACIALSLTVPFLEFVPFASSAPMAAIAMFGLALMVRDGLLMLVASGIAGLAIYLVASLWLGLS